MKKSIIIILLSIGTTSIAQVYISAGAGYCFQASGLKPIEPFVYYNSNPYASNYVGLNTGRISNYSLAAGKGFNIDIGYMRNKNIGFELGITTVMGNTYTSNFNVTNQTDSTSGYTYIGYFKITAIPVILTPSIVFNTNKKKGMSLYCKIGLPIIVASNQKSIHFQNVDAPGIIKDVYNEDKIKYGIGFGLAGTLGLNITIKKNISIGVEYKYQSLNPFIGRSVTSKYTRDGEDLTSTLTKQQKEVYYIAQFDMNQSPPQFFDPDAPAKFIGFHTNYSYMGFMVNVTYSFDKKKKRK